MQYFRKTCKFKTDLILPLKETNMFDPTAGYSYFKTVLFNIAILLELLLFAISLGICLARKSSARKHQTILVCILVLFNVSVFVGAIFQSLILMAIIFIGLFLPTYLISWIVISPRK